MNEENNITTEDLNKPATKGDLKKEIEVLDQKIDDLRSDLPEMITKYTSEAILPEIKKTVQDGLAPYKHLLAQKGDAYAKEKNTTEVEELSQVAENTRLIDRIISWIEKASVKIGVEFRRD